MLFYPKIENRLKSRIVSSIRLPRAHDSTALPSLPPLRSSSIHSRFNDGALHTALRPRSRPRVYSHRDHASFVRPKILDGGQNSSTAKSGARMICPQAMILGTPCA